MRSKCLICTLLALCFATAIFSQKTFIYPVKVDHKWGFINGRGTIIIPPTYDLMAQEDLAWYNNHYDSLPSPFRLVEINEKAGLINAQKELVISASYDLISPISPDYFLVEKEGNVRLIDKSENTILENAYDNIRFLGFNPSKSNAFFAVQQNERWGVFSSAGKLVIPVKYQSLEFVGGPSVNFKVKLDKRMNWGMINPQNKLVFKYRYEDIKCFHPNFFALKRQHAFWEARDTLDNQLLNAHWALPKALNKHLLKLSLITKEGKLYLYPFTQKDTIPLSSRRWSDVQALNEKHAIYSRNGRLGLLDKHGNMIFSPNNARAIENWSAQYYKIQETYLWGLYDVAQNRIRLPYRYIDIQPFENGYAIVRRAEGTGVMNTQFREVIPCIYSEIRREDDVFKAFSGNTISLIELDQNGEVTRLDDYNNVRSITIKSQIDGPVEDAKPIKNIKTVEDELYFYETNRSSKIIDASPYEWHKSRENKRWGLKGPITKPAVYRSVQHISKVRRTLVYQYENPVSNAFTKLLAPPVDTLYRLSIFSHRTGTFITESDFIGLRRHDFQRALPYAAMITDEGEFGLINKEGEQAKDKNGKPLRFSYIGEFHNDRARVCVGGQFKVMEDLSKLKYTVEDRQYLRLKFTFIHPPLASGKVKEGRIYLEAKPGEELKWGYVDTLGQVVIEPKYDYAKDFSNGQAVVVKNKNWGLIDRNEQTIIDFEFGSISDYYDAWKINKRAGETIYFNQKGWEIANFSYEERGLFIEERCQVKEAGKWGFIDEEGSKVIPCVYDAVQDFSEGLAAVQKDSSWAFIKKDGTPAFHLDSLGIKAEELGNFHNGLCWFMQDSLYGYLDTTGRVQISPKFVKVFDFQDGVARIVANRKTGLIDTSGTYILEPEQFERIDPFNEYGVAMVMQSFRSGKKGLIDRAGKLLCPPKYQTMDAFKDGHSRVSIDGKTFGLLNSKGQEVVVPKFEVMGTFSEGFVPVKELKRQNWQYVDTLGKIAFPEEFESAYPFNGGFARVQEKDYDIATRKYIDTKGRAASLAVQNVLFFEEGIAGMFRNRMSSSKHYYHYANKNGELLFGQFFQKVGKFKGDIALIKSNWRNGFINRRGLMVVPPKYVSLELMEEGLIMARPPAFGLAQQDGKILIPPIYDHIQLMSGNIYKIERGEKIGYMNKRGKWIWELQN